MNYTGYKEDLLAKREEVQLADGFDELEYLRWEMLHSIGSLCFHFRNHHGSGAELDLDSLKVTSKRLLNTIVVYGEMHEMSELEPYLEGIKNPYLHPTTDMATITDMLENAISLTKSSRHNPYLVSLVEKVLFGLMKILGDRGVSVSDLME